MRETDWWINGPKAALQALRREPFYFLCFCLYLILEYVRPQSVYPMLAFLPWSKVVVAATLLSFLISKHHHSVKQKTGYLILGLLGAVVLSASFAEFPDLAYSEITVVCNWLIIYYMFINIVTTRFRFYVVLSIIILASYKMSQHAAISWARRGFSFERWGIAGTPGYFGNAADLGVQMLIILPLAYFLVRRCFKNWSLKGRLFWVFLPISVIMTIIATGERNTLLGLASILIVAPLCYKHRMRNIIGATVLVLLIYMIIPKPFLDRFETAGTDRTSQSRLIYWKRGLNFFKDHPVLGIGYNNWRLYYQKFNPGESLRSDAQEVAHSTPITVLAELGLLGFIFYYGIAVLTIATNIRSTKYLKSSEGYWKDIPFALNLGICGFLTASLFITVTFYPFLFIQASLTEAIHNILKRELNILEHPHTSLMKDEYVNWGQETAQL